MCTQKRARLKSTIVVSTIDLARDAISHYSSANVERPIHKSGGWKVVVQPPLLLIVSTVFNADEYWHLEPGGFWIYWRPYMHRKPNSNARFNMCNAGHTTLEASEYTLSLLGLVSHQLNYYRAGCQSEQNSLSDRWAEIEDVISRMPCLIQRPMESQNVLLPAPITAATVFTPEGWRWWTRPRPTNPLIRLLHWRIVKKNREQPTEDSKSRFVVNDKPNSVLSCSDPDSYSLQSLPPLSGA